MVLMDASCIAIAPTMASDTHAPKTSNPTNTHRQKNSHKQVTGKVYWLLPEGVNEANYDGLHPAST